MAKKLETTKGMDNNFYPTIELTEDNQLAPHIPLPHNYKKLLPRFYKNGGREAVETYSEKLQETLQGSSLGKQVRLTWHIKNGLTHIFANGKSSLDLEEDEQHHAEYHGTNLTPEACILSDMVAQQYIALLLTSNGVKTHKNKFTTK